MYAPRRILVGEGYRDADGVKLYEISAAAAAVEAHIFLPQLARMKALVDVPWSETPAFAIFHQGADFPYSVGIQ